MMCMMHVYNTSNKITLRNKIVTCAKTLQTGAGITRGGFVSVPQSGEADAGHLG